MSDLEIRVWGEKDYIKMLLSEKGIDAIVSVPELLTVPHCVVAFERIEDRAYFLLVHPDIRLPEL